MSDVSESGVYSNKEILKAIQDRHIFFLPYVEEHINTSSVDVTLGENYFGTDRDTSMGIYNPYDPEDVARYFGEAQSARPYREYKVGSHFKIDGLVGIEPDFPVILLGPGERILAHTHEFIGIMPPGTSSMHGRSTTGRNGVSVCVDAGWGDSGYINRWTMEIANLNRRHHIVLPLGERIAQIVFHHTGEVDGEYSSDTGKYQTAAATDIAEIIENWRPEDMLPKAWRDKRRMPLAVDASMVNAVQLD